jgi:glycosyltransferase involved in cell wall biosynthesis
MKIAVFLQDLAGGGAERVAVITMNGLVADHAVTLLLARREGPYLADLDPRIEVVHLGRSSTFASVGRLAAFLRRHRPDVIMTHLTHVNVVGALANRLAGKPCPQVAVEHNQMGLNFSRIPQCSVRLAYRAARYVYRDIARVVSVSEGVRRSVIAFTGGKGARHAVIHNPVVTDALRQQMAAPAEHPWLCDAGAPVIVGCGRLVEQKDFPNLLRAFAHFAQFREGRLLVLGEGEQRSQLESLIEEFGLGDRIALPGFARNPYAAMGRSAMFVLSSRWEGLPTVLIEAMATGANIVSTDCPSGPDEVLDHGRFGRLVPVADSAALAAAMIDAIDAPMAGDAVRERADLYTAERALAHYLALFRELSRQP